MKSTRWTDYAELAGIVAIVGSLIFVGLQMRQTQNIALNEDGYSRIASEIDEKNSVFEHADIWVRGNAGEELDRVESMIYKDLLRTKWNRAFWNNGSELRLGRTSNVSIHDFAWFLHQNPGAKKVWLEDADERNRQRTLLLPMKPTGPMAIQNIVRADLEKLARLNP